ncbi:hypothetical protein BDR22DRAFT_826470 [Usnea florida]
MSTEGNSARYPTPSFTNRECVSNSATCSTKKDDKATYCINRNAFEISVEGISTQSLVLGIPPGVATALKISVESNSARFPTPKETLPCSYNVMRIGSVFVIPPHIPIKRNNEPSKQQRCLDDFTARSRYRFRDAYRVHFRPVANAVRTSRTWFESVMC